MKISTITLLFLLFLSRTISGQNEITIEDYNRAVGYMYDNYNNKKVFNTHIKPNWFPDSTGVWFINHTPDTKKYLKVTFPDMVQSDVFDHEKMAVALNEVLGGNIKATDLPISNIVYENTHELLITALGKKFVYDTKTETLTKKVDKKSTNTNKIVSPDKKWEAYTKDYNLYIKSLETNEVKQLSTKGKKGYEYASWYGWYDTIEGENGKRPEHFWAEWSKDSEWIYANICDLSTAKKMYLLDWSIDSLYRPKLLSYYRGSPGDTDMVYIDPVFFNIKTGKEIKPNLPRSTHINDIEVTRSSSPNKVYLQQMDRGFKKVSIYSFDLANEKLDTVYTESSTTNIDNFRYEFLDTNNLMFFLSEKSGWRQLYSINLKTKKETPITNGNYYINGIERIDEKNKTIYFRASSKEQGRNPYHQHLYSISFNGKNLKLLTKENLHHSVSISPDNKYFVDNLSDLQTPTTTVLRNTSNGKVLLELGRADITKLEGWNPPEAFTATARDGKTTIYGALWKPSNFDPNKKYPVLEMTYTGPHTQLFPNSFSRAFRLQTYAELGFIAVVVDGLGSSGRSKEFHDHSYKNLSRNLEDHIIAIKELGKKYSWVDTTRVGIFGHSAGGYDTGRALLGYPEFYKVGVASSADHDHRMEKAWWPEMYMGWPVDENYHSQSNITEASKGNLKGKLLLVHGGIDENVNPSATFKLAETLIKADKPFDMLIIPSQRHQYRGIYKNYFLKVKWNYFVEHLLGAEPIWDFKW